MRDVTTSSCRSRLRLHRARSRPVLSAPDIHRLGDMGRRTRSVCTALLCVGLVGLPGVSTAATPTATPDVTDLRAAQRSADGVEVSTYGARWVPTTNNALEDQTLQAVHAVQRVGDRTVVYWSIGTESEDGFSPVLSSYGRDPARLDKLEALSSAPWVNVALPGRGTLLYAVQVPGARGPGFPAAATSGREALPDGPGVMGVQYAVLPALPDDVEEVEVTIGYAGVVTDVPVGDGLLEPTAPGPVVPLGSGWPEVPAEHLGPGPVDRVDFSVRRLFAVSEQLDGFSRESEAGESVTIDVAADVLFAVDSAELSPAAAGRLRQVGADVTGRAAPGALSVVGHTDSDGSDAYNEDLSARRARAVADVLAPGVTGEGLDLTVEGRGEREPVADNATDAGKQANRRVAITFTEEQR